VKRMPPPCVAARKLDEGTCLVEACRGPSRLGSLRKDLRNAGFQGLSHWVQDIHSDAHFAPANLIPPMILYYTPQSG
jgi:hypothetical protein